MLTSKSAEARTSQLNKIVYGLVIIGPSFLQTSMIVLAVFLLHWTMDVLSSYSVTHGVIEVTVMLMKGSCNALCQHDIVDAEVPPDFETAFSLSLTSRPTSDPTT